jgi:hypothetical protein
MRGWTYLDIRNYSGGSLIQHFNKSVSFPNFEPAERIGFSGHVILFKLSTNRKLGTLCNIAK